MVARRHLGFCFSPKMTSRTLRAANDHQCTKFGEDIWYSGWVMTIFLSQDDGRPPSWILIRVKNGITARCGLSMSTITPNLVTMTQMAAELLRFSFFSKWRPAAILDFVVAQKWHHSTLRAIHDYQRTDFGEDIWQRLSYGDFPFSTWRPAAILDFDTGQKWRYGTLRMVNVYHRAKFCNCTSTGGWVITFCGKIQNGGVRHFEAILNLYLAILDHPRSSLMALKAHRKFGVNRTFTFQDIAIWKFWKFGLKRVFRPPKFTFLGGFNH